MNASIDCSVCRYEYTGSPDIPTVLDCPSCKLFSRIDNHFSDVFQNILSQYYAGHIFEIEDYHQFWLRSWGISFLRDRKRNQEILQKNHEIGVKTFYLLMYSHIEAIFYDVQSFMNEQDIKYSVKIISQFSKYCRKDKSFQYDLDFKGRFFKAVEFIRLTANVIKHTSCIIEHDSDSGKLLKEKFGFKYGDSIFDNEGPVKGLGKQVDLFDVYDLACMAHVYFRDIASILTKTSHYRYKSYNKIQSTYELLDLQMRRDIGRRVVVNSGNDGIMLIPNFDLRYMSFNNIEKLYNLKIEIIELLYKNEPQDVARFEIYGDTHYVSRRLEVLVSRLHWMLIDNVKPRKILEDPKNLNKEVKILFDFLKEVAKIYDEETVLKILRNQFHLLKKNMLPEYIMDFYVELSSCNKNNRAIILRLLGAAPFRSWDPFLFGMNKINYW